jgi:hypothetical protein
MSFSGVLVVALDAAGQLCDRRLCNGPRVALRHLLPRHLRHSRQVVAMVVVVMVMIMMTMMMVLVLTL